MRAGTRPARAPSHWPAEQLFEGFRAALSPHLDERDAAQLALSDRDVASYSTPAMRLKDAPELLFALRSHDGECQGLQHKTTTLTFRKGLLVDLALWYWLPARGPGGYDVAGTFGARVAARTSRHVELLPNGERHEVVSTSPETLLFRVAYRPCEAGAFRLLRALLGLGDLLELPVRLVEGSDC